MGSAIRPLLRRFLSRRDGLRKRSDGQKKEINNVDSANRAKPAKGFQAAVFKRFSSEFKILRCPNRLKSRVFCH
jgi:hypothetical protein